MPLTPNITGTFEATRQWVLVAEGPGFVEVEPTNADCRRFFGDPNTSPTIADTGISLPRNHHYACNLLAGQGLYIRGSGNVQMTAEIPRV